MYTTTTTRCLQKFFTYFLSLIISQKKLKLLQNAAHLSRKVKHFHHLVDQSYQLLMINDQLITISESNDERAT